MLMPALLAAAMSTAPPATARDYAGDARALDQLIVENYAYEDHWPSGKLPDSPVLTRERNAVHDRESLLHYAEDRMASLADHHAITGASFKDSWAIVPTYADLWIVRRGADYVVDSVKIGSPAAKAGIVAGDRLVAVAGTSTASALPVSGARSGWTSLTSVRITPRVFSLPGGATARAIYPSRMARCSADLPFPACTPSIQTGRRSPSAALRAAKP